MDFFKVSEVARRYGVHEDTIRRFIRSGRLRAVWVGRSIRIRAEDAERLVEDPRFTECRTCEARIPSNAAACPRCGGPNSGQGR